MIKYIVLSSIFGFILIAACNNNNAPTPAAVNTDTEKVEDTTKACENPETVMDPNQAKPMALMMRQMVKNVGEMKTKIEAGEKLDSTKYPFIRFYLVEPTDPSVLEPQFYENARLFQEAYTSLFKHPNEQKKYYNLVIGKCIGCHENYCSGPLKRIRKLML